MTKKEYVEKAVSDIKSKSLRREVEDELSDHLDDLTQLWIGRGFHPLDAEEKAVEEMGLPEKTAEGLGAIHSNVRFVVSRVFAVSLTIFCVCLAAATICFWRFSFFIISLLFVFGGFESRLIAELLLFSGGGLTLLYAKRKKDPLLCAASAIPLLAYTGILLLPQIVELIDAAFSYGSLTEFSGWTPASPSVLFLAAAVTGHYGDLTAEISSDVYAASPVLTAISAVMYSLWFAAVLIVFITAIKRRKRRCGRKTVRMEKYAARIAAAICALIPIAALPAIVCAGGNGSGENGSILFDGWYLQQCDAQEDNVEIPSYLCDLPEDAYYIEIDRDFGPFYLDRRNSEDRHSTSDSIRWADASVDGLFDVFGEVAEWELEAESRYLYAVPADDGRLLPEYAEWFDLTDPKPIWLPIGTEPTERYSLIGIDTARE